jgi:hypothetical protein
MSIVITIPNINEKCKKIPNEFQYEESVIYDDILDNINLPKDSHMKSNDLSMLEVSVNSSKCTFSGGEMNSNLSYDSHIISRISKNVINCMESEIILDFDLKNNFNISYDEPNIEKEIQERNDCPK